MLGGHVGLIGGGGLGIICPVRTNGQWLMGAVICLNILKIDSLCLQND